MSWCRQPEIGLPKPDAVLFLQLSPEAASQRADFGEERYEQREFQDKVARNYSHLMDESWKVGFNPSSPPCRASDYIIHKKIIFGSTGASDYIMHRKIIVGSAGASDYSYLFDEKCHPICTLFGTILFLN